MKRTVVLIALLLLSQISIVHAETDEMAHRANGKFLPDQQDVEGSPTQESACDCCQKCKAAMKPGKPQLEEEDTTKSGCEDCCQKCGRPVHPAPEDIPPEIINKPRSK